MKYQGIPYYGSEIHFIEDANSLFKEMHTYNNLGSCDNQIRNIVKLK